MAPPTSTLFSSLSPLWPALEAASYQHLVPAVCQPLELSRGNVSAFALPRYILPGQGAASCLAGLALSSDVLSS